MQKRRKCFIKVYINWMTMFKILTRSRYRSIWSPFRADILTILPSLISSRVGLTRFSSPPRLSLMSRSLRNFSFETEDRCDKKTSSIQKHEGSAAQYEQYSIHRWMLLISRYHKSMTSRPNCVSRSFSFLFIFNWLVYICTYVFCMLLSCFWL